MVSPRSFSCAYLPCLGQGKSRTSVIIDDETLFQVEILIYTLIHNEVDATRYVSCTIFFLSLVTLSFPIYSDPNTLFRGNSLASKVIDEFMKLVGCSYLQCTLQACIDEVGSGLIYI